MKITLTKNDFMVMRLLEELEATRDALEEQTKVFNTYIKDSANLMIICIEQLNVLLERVDV